jgi:hypothetical protein
MDGAFYGRVLTLTESEHISRFEFLPQGS